ncbi:MAG: peptide ABC transporter substrate-binding protein [Anaerolineae bacterium]|nr:peptide ABC transporter substrate-binding protein [Anaerolineae bacterium]
MKHAKQTLLILLVLCSLLLAACIPDGGGSEGAPVVLRINWGTEPPALDPSLATDSTSINVIHSLFAGLTQFDPLTGEVLPYLATSWDISDDGLTYTFHLRGDLPWVQYDPTSGVVSAVEDADGNIRYVDAYDVVYGVKRTLDPDTGSGYAYVMYVIKNGAAVNGGEEGLTLDDLGVRAVDAATVEFTLEHAAAFFPSITAMWTAWPQPEWVVEEFGDSWTEAENIITNGSYVLDTWVHGDQLVLVKNPLWINAESVQIDRVEGVMIVEESTEFALYENNELETGRVPLADMDRVRNDPVLSQELYIAPAPCTYYYSFNTQKYPMTDSRVRAAFVMAIDRQSLVENVTKGGQIPATSFAPPGIFGAPAPGEVGLHYDPAAAAALLDEFLAEEGMTLEEFNALGIVLMHNTSEGHARIAGAIQQMWTENLGVEVNVENQEWAVFLTTVGNTTPIEDAPHIFRNGWCADYPDENNWVHEVFNAQAGANDERRNCKDVNCGEVGTSRFDELTLEALLETDPDKRIELYREAERILAEEEVAFAPIYHYTTVNVSKPWLTRNYPVLGGLDFWNWKVDLALRP